LENNSLSLFKKKEEVKEGGGGEKILGV